MPSAAMDTPPAGLGLPVLRGASATPSSTPPTHRPAGITHTDNRQPTTDGRQPLYGGPSVAAQEPQTTDGLPLYDASIIVFASNG